MAKIPVVDKTVPMVQRPTNLVVIEGSVNVGDVVEAILRVNGVEIVSEYAPYTVEVGPAHEGAHVHVQLFLNVQDRSDTMGAPATPLS